jgi:hypothetical protein
MGTHSRFSNQGNSVLADTWVPINTPIDLCIFCLLTVIGEYVTLYQTISSLIVVFCAFNFYVSNLCYNALIFRFLVLCWVPGSVQAMKEWLCQCSPQMHVKNLLKIVESPTNMTAISN